jgi:hypothetical protein
VLDVRATPDLFEKLVMGDDLSRISPENEQRFVFWRRQVDLRGPYQKLFKSGLSFLPFLANLQSLGNMGQVKQ